MFFRPPKAVANVRRSVKVRSLPLAAALLSARSSVHWLLESVPLPNDIHDPLFPASSWIRTCDVIALYITVQTPLAILAAPKRTCADFRSAAAPRESEYESVNVCDPPVPEFGVDELACTVPPTVHVPRSTQPVVQPVMLVARIDTALGPPKRGESVSGSVSERSVPLVAADVSARSSEQ